MIKIFLKYKLAEIAINTFFSKLNQNFNFSNITIKGSDLTNEHIGCLILGVNGKMFNIPHIIYNSWATDGCYAYHKLIHIHDVVVPVIPIDSSDIITIMIS